MNVRRRFTYGFVWGCIYGYVLYLLQFVVGNPNVSDIAALIGIASLGLLCGLVGVFIIRE